MSDNKQKREILKKKLFTKNRLIILNEDTFEEFFSLRLTLMNVFVVATSGAIIIIFITTYIIAFTPLREYIPGYASTKLKKEATELALKSDSLSSELNKNEAYIAGVKKVLLGELEVEKFNKDSILTSQADTVSNLNLKASAEEIELRKEVFKKEKTKK
jgi:hypothetical protein